MASLHPPTADSTWHDLSLRAGPVSPDILPRGAAPVNPALLATQDSLHAPVCSPGFLAGKPNYIYLRAHNTSPTDQKAGTSHLAVMDPGLVAWPHGPGWTPVRTNSDEAGSPLGPAGPHAVAVTADPFVHLPLASGHRCVVAWLSTPDHPVPDPLPVITDAAALAGFLQHTPNYAWHNLQAMPGTTGAHAFMAPFWSGTTDATWMCGVKLRNCRGFTVSLSSAATLPDGTRITLPSTTVMDDDEVTLMLGPVRVPAGWTTTLTCICQTHGLQPASFAAVLVAAVVLEDDDGANTRITHAPAPASHTRTSPHADTADLRVVTVGSMGIMKGTPSP